jgi:hypothetical protein
VALETNGTVRRTRVHFNQVDFVVFHRELDVHQAANLQLEGQLLHLLRITS